MSDLIDRQAAIDAAIKGADSYYVDSIEAEINGVSSAQLAPDQNGDLWITVPDIDDVTCIYVQESESKFCRIFYEEQEQPEIVLCKDCKHHWTHKCMDSMPIERCDLEQTFYDAEVDYCSLAERREVTT